MTENEDSRLLDDPAFRRLRTLRARLSTGYSLLVLGLFALFVAASALFPSAMAARLIEGSPFSIALLAALLMVVAPVLMAALFLRKTDNTIEPLRTELAGKRDAGDSQAAESQAGGSQE